MPVNRGGNPNQPGGVTGVLGNVRDLAHLVQLLKPYFLPTSLVAAPNQMSTAAPTAGAGGASGSGRTSLGTMTLEQLSDVKIYAPTTGQALVYIGNVAKWENVTVGSVTSVTASPPLASSGGATPNISLTGIVPILNGGTGTATPALVAGTNITITGAFPNQTINSTNPGGTVTSVTATAPLSSTGGTTPNIALTTPLAVAYGGTGSATTGSGVTAVTASGALASSGGTTPNITLTAPLSIANGGTGSTTANFVTAVTASGNIASSGGLTPAITFTGILPVANGGTGSATAGSGVTAVTATAPITSTGGATPVIALTTPLALIYGGTGSTTQNFVDLTTAQTVAGAKTFSASIVSSGSITAAVNVSAGTPYASLATGDMSAARSTTTGYLFLGSNGSQYVGFNGTLFVLSGAGVQVGGTVQATTGSFSTPLAIGSGGTGSATQNFVDLSTAQTVAGLKTFSVALQAASFTVGASGPTITTGSTVPVAANVAGSIYLRSPGAAGARVYVGQGGITWTAIATV